MKILAIILFVVPFVAIGQGGCKIPRKDLTRFINWKIKSDNESKKYYEIKRVNTNAIIWDSLDYKLIIESDSLENIFSDSDIQYLQQQIKCYSGATQKWNIKELKGVTIITSKQPSEIQTDGDYWEYSVPIFSKSHSICIIKYAYVCGDLCMSFSTVVYKKTRHGWVEVVELLHGEA